MVRWDNLKVFVAAYQAGSCAAAARTLGLSQSTVSRRLADLEESLGGALFARGPEGLIALPAADRIYSVAESVQSHMDDLMNVFARAETGVRGAVRVALSDMMASDLIAPALPALFAEHPELVVEFVTGEHVVDLTRHKVDLALRLVRPTTGDLIIKRVASLRFGVYGHRDYLARHRTMDVGDLSWVDWDSSQVELPGSAWLRTFLPNAEPVFRTTSLSARLRFLCAGLGVAVVADTLAERHPHLQKLSGLPDLPVLPLWLVGRRARSRIPRIKVVWDFLVDRAQELNRPLETPALKREG